MVYKFKSAKYIINKVYDMLPSSVEVNVDSIYNDLGEVLANFYNAEMLIQDRQIIQIKNYVGELPCDFAVLKQFARCGKPLNKNTSTLGVNVQLKEDTIPTVYINGFEYSKDDLPLMITNQTTYGNNDYEIRDGLVYVSFEEGELYCSYLKYPLDEEGLPLVPDDELFDTGFKFYCLYMYFMRLWIDNDETVERKMVFFKNEWEKYEPKLRARSSSPDLMTMENIKKIWLRPYQKINEAKSFYSGLNQHQQIRNRS
jgi:hypothetical protein